SSSSSAMAGLLHLPFVRLRNICIEVDKDGRMYLKFTQQSKIIRLERGTNARVMEIMTLYQERIRQAADDDENQHLVSAAVSGQQLRSESACEATVAMTDAH